MTRIGSNHCQDSRSPKVSILLPNLNTRPFLEERIQTILDQTLTDWELVIVDNYSDDGAWEFFQECARDDARIRISQAPREGMYANWNNCIRLARGEYVYVATSDDTMEPDCLEKMVAALDAYPECDVCHCCLKVIDENSNELAGWWLKLPAQRFYGGMVFRPHIRKAPLDGLLHTCLTTTYHSITQLLIRRTTFQKWGLFKTQWGSRCDFEWGMRVSLVCNTVHIPEFLATWRIHSAQATNLAMTQATYEDAIRDLVEMVASAVRDHTNNGTELGTLLDPDYLSRFYRKRLLITDRAHGLSVGHRVQLLCDRLSNTVHSVAYRLGSLLGRKHTAVGTSARYASHLLHRFGISMDSHIVTLD